MLLGPTAPGNFAGGTTVIERRGIGSTSDRHFRIWCRLASLALLLLASGAGPAARLGAAPPRVLAQGLPPDSRLGPLKTLDGYFPFLVPPTAEAWQTRAERLRRQVRVSQGLWPEPTRTPLEAVVHGRVDRPGYTVEKVYFQSLPGHYVSGNLYRPLGRTGPLPAVLCPHGHWDSGRFQDHGPREIRRLIVAGEERFERGGRHVIQSRCVQLARMGCVVFHYDMEGYADSHQLAHRAGVREKMNTPTDWGFFSPQAELRLQTMMGLQTWNSVRALDFLTSLPEVDSARIGVTGASGGGTQTFLLTAIDSRPAAAFPAVMVSTAMQGGCTCENASYLRVDTGNIELAALMAPKPLGLSGANDWTHEIMTKGYPELQALYRLLGAPDKVWAKALLQFGHNYNYVSRAMMYAFLNQHLALGQEEPIVEEDYEPLSREELSVWNDQHPRPPGGEPHERQLARWLTTDSDQQLDALRPRDSASFDRWRGVVGGALEVMIGHQLPGPETLSVETTASTTHDGYRQVLALVRSQAEQTALPVAFLLPSTPVQRAILWAHPQGKAGLYQADGQPRAEVRKCLDRGLAVVGADLLYQGEFLTADQSAAEAPLVHPAQKELDGYAGYTFGYNHSLFAQRTIDLLTLIALVTAVDAGNPLAGLKSVDLLGSAGAGPWVAAARALAGDRVRRAAIDTGGFRFAGLDKLSHPDFLPGAVKYGDLPALLALSAPLPLWVAGEGSSLPELVRAAYQARGGQPALVQHSAGGDSTAAALEWLAAPER